MDPNHVFNSPSFDAASGLSRPPRLAKLRKPLTGHRPNLMRPNNNNVIIPGLSSVEPGRENVGRGFGFASNSSSGGGSKLFAETVMSSSDVEKSKVVDKLSGLQIGIEETFAQSKNSGNVSSSSSIGGAHLSAKDHGLPGVDQSVVSELPDEMRRLYIESQHFTKKNGGNMEGELPTKMKKLNIKDYERETFAFGRNDNESVGGSLDTMFPNKMKGLKIKESLDTSVIQKLDNEVSSKDNTNKFMFGKSGNANSPGDFNTATAVGNNSNHTKSSVSSQFGTDTMHNMQTGNPGDGNFPSGSGPFNSGYTFQAGLQSKNMGTHTSDGSGSTSTSSPLFASSITRIKPIGDVPQTPFVDRAEKTVEFSFTSKLGSVAAQNVEFTTPDPKGHSVFGLNRKGETKRESAKDTGLKKKKGKWKKPAYFPPKFGQDFGSQDNSQKNHESTEQYSPMDVSPYEEILVDNRFSRETSVASDESFQLDENNSSTEVHSDIPNDMAEECLISATERLYINKSDVKCSNVPDQESLFHVNETIELENPEEGAVSGAETESFKSATDEIDYSTDSFITAADFEVSSGSSVERQDSDGGTQFKYDTSLPHPGEAGFIFASSSASPSVSSASIRDQKKKNRSKGIQDSYSSTQSFKVSHPSSGFPPIQVSGSSSLSPKKDQKSDFSSLLSNRRDKSEKVKELQTKQDSTQAASVAAQESCEKWRLRGNQAYAKGDFLKAEDCYTHGVNCISQNEASRSCLRALMLCYSNRAATRMSLGRVREALEDCVKAAALDPSFLRVQVRAASCYLALGDVENATLHFMKILQEGPDVCADRKLLVDASEGLEKAQKVAECEKQAAELLRRRTPSDVDFAISLIAEALMISSYSEKLLQMKADALLVLKKYEDLIQFCEQLLSVESNFPKSGVGHSVELHGSDLNRAPSLRIWCCSLVLKSYFYLGKLEEGLVFVKKQEESVSLMERSGSKTLESMIPLVGTIRELLHHKTAGNEAYQSGNHAEAVEHYTASISCSVESPPFAAICFCNRAAAYRAMGQIVDALADCSLAIALDGNYFKAISRRAALYEMIRDYGQAVTDLQKLVSLLTKEVDKKKNQSGSSDKVNCVNELRQARQKLLEMEEAARKEIPLNMYLILGIEPSAAASEIRKAYRKAALKYHPDKAGQSLVRNENSDDGIWKEIVEEVHKDADRLFKMIGEAYAVLSDPTKRSRYDLEEEMRTARGNGSSMTKMYTDFQNYSSERSGSRRQWQEVRRTYETSRGRSERNWYY